VYVRDTLLLMLYHCHNLIMDLFFVSALKVKLMLRRPINQLVAQGIMPCKYSHLSIECSSPTIRVFAIMIAYYNDILVIYILDYLYITFFK
jgi:hypothetical protein